MKRLRYTPHALSRQNRRLLRRCLLVWRRAVALCFGFCQGVWC